MKLFSKVFVSTLIIITLALGLIGYLLISTNFDSALKRELAGATEGFHLVRYNLLSNMIAHQKYGVISDVALLQSAENTCHTVPSMLNIKIYEGESFSLLCQTDSTPTVIDLNEANLNEIQHKLIDTTIVSIGAFTQSGRLLYIYETRDISAVFNQTNELISYYKTIYAIVLAVCAITSCILFYILTRPIGRLTQAAEKISAGDYTARVTVTSNDEIGALSQSFIHMTDTIQAKIQELELNAQQKEDFVANFAHELKTPLTSIIGYADMIYQKNLSKEAVHEAAGYILNEGMRVEALSQKLMELIVLDKQDFMLMESRIDEMLIDAVDTIKPIAEQKGTALRIEAEPVYIFAEQDLFKTMLLNFIDNSIKSGAKNIVLSAELLEGVCRVSVKDDGCGIPKNEISRITEAFYMVDKSRSRKQHGAGLGLAISTKIANLHKTQIKYESVVDEGTTVFFDVKVLEDKC